MAVSANYLLSFGEHLVALPATSTKSVPGMWAA
jgi:hypothetical protein